MCVAGSVVGCWFCRQAGVASFTTTPFLFRKEPEDAIDRFFFLLGIFFISLTLISILLMWRRRRWYGHIYGAHTQRTALWWASVMRGYEGLTGRAGVGSVV
jgi:hypothetical protein